MARFNIPERQYVKGKKISVSMRLPKLLKDELEAIAVKKGWNFTDLVTTVLDQFLQSEKKEK